jgi:CRISPR-associated endonuclease/helicase Cas3
VQRAGRLSRFSETAGELHVIVPQKNGALYPAPYGRYVKGAGWEPTAALTKTLDLLQCKTYTVKAFVEAVDLVYPETQEFSFATQQNVKRYIDHMISNWLIVPDAFVNEDSDGALLWRSRNIAPQVEVLVKAPDSYYSRYVDFQAYKLECSLTIPVYLHKSLLNKGALSKHDIQVQDDQEQIFLVDQLYTFEKGLAVHEDPSSFL